METYDQEICARCAEPSPRGAAACPACGQDPRLDGRYRLLRRLGHGAVGTTFAAEREADGQPVAVKELLVRRLEDFKAHDLFTREAGVLRTLEHPAIPRYLDDFAAGEGRHLGLYLVTELIEGETLEAEMQRRRHSQREVLGIVRELCDVLAYLHGLAPPVMHRDIKPSNVMRRSADGSLVLIDFGAVRESLRGADGGSTVAGTFGYMPPEQLAGRASPASDVYALGVVLVVLMTRKAAHELLDDRNQLQWAEHLPPGLQGGPLHDLLAEVLEPDPARRLGDAAELGRRLDDIIAGRARSAPARAAARGGGGFGGRAPAAFDAVPGARGAFERLADKLGGIIEAAQRPVAPGQAEPPPPAPRKVPFGFGGKADPVGGFFRLFGILFGGIPLIIFISFLGGGMPFPFSLLPLVFVAIGGTLGAVGFVRIARAKRLFRDGETAPAIVTESWLNTSLKVNGRSPWKVVFRYETPDGKVHEGTVSRFRIPPELRMPGAQVFALYDPKEPSRATMWPL
ncbi:MAG: protein kinase [Deltaproteobacteria bacterium]|nr:protein kinase [Deltaproteobacteria bacterium]